MIGELPDDGRITLGTDKVYDAKGFVAEMRRLGVKPHFEARANLDRLPIG